MSHDLGDAADLQEVEIDQGALVSILSRYPGAFDILRELIQNADDADASRVQIHFQTGEAENSRRASISDLGAIQVRKWIIKDNGSGFEKKDWERLGKIASGNDNSSKVGAFGVGFYSVLSKSDRPLVMSNGKSLQFERGKDRKLRKRFGSYKTDSWTSIELELRDPEQLPVLADLTKFLVSSVAFLAKIEAISVHLDGQRVLNIGRVVQSASMMVIPQHLKSTTPKEALTVQSIQRIVQRIVVDAKECVFASSSMSASPDVDAEVLVERPGRSQEDRLTRTFRRVDTILEDNAITHDLYKATTSVNLNKHPDMKKGVESCMKSLPTSFECKAVYFNSEQSLADIDNSYPPKIQQLARLFCGSQGIFPGNDSGRLFIGQSTNQTTGIGLHISAHFLPTMERGAIDLANGHVKAWNKEVLHVGGFLARVIYEEEMNAAKSKDDHAAQLGLGLRTMARFAFGNTVPHSGVSQILQHAFFSCCHEPKAPFPVVSNIGISCASDPQFRQNNKELLFLKKYLVFNEDVELRQRSQIVSRYEIPLFKFGDLIREFESGVTEDAMKAFFAWWEDARKNSPSSSSSSKTAREQFCRQFASRSEVYSNQGVKTEFKNIKYFTFFSLPIDLSPLDTIYIDAASGVPTRSAVECFGWTQLSALHWLKYACSRASQLSSVEDSGRDSDVGYRILRVLVQFALVKDLSLPQWDEAAELMKNLKCIPTNMGLQLPANSYFDDAAVCKGLPVARETEFLNIPPFEYRFVDMDLVQKVMARIRVHSMMDWKDMVRRLEEEASEDSNYRLLRYLAIIHSGRLADRQINDLKLMDRNINDLKLMQTNDLKEKKIFRSENHGQTSVTELLLPNEDVRKIGLPILAFRRNGLTFLQTDVGPSDSFVVEQFIESLGILRYPTLDKIIMQAASDKPDVRRPALQHLLANLDDRYNAYQPDNFSQYAFIPTKCDSLARPNEVFASPIWGNLGFKQASEDMARDLSRLGVKENPSADTIIEAFKASERKILAISAAADLFEHLHLHGNLPISKLHEQLSTVPFVPAKTPGASPSESSIEHFSPKDCFIESEDTKNYYRDVFPFVNFGQNGNSFLEFCSAKKSPNASDMVRKILQDPKKYLKALGDTLYREDLRTIASQLDSISEEDKQHMKRASMFPAEQKGKTTEELLPAEQVLISDWESRDFGGGVHVAPKDDILEKMYLEMGSVFLGTYVRHDVTTIGSKADCPLPFDHDQVTLRVRCFMKMRGESGKTGVSFNVPGSTNKLRVMACKDIKLKKTFAPPFGVGPNGMLAAIAETKSVHMKAGVKYDEDDELYTLWMVCGASDPKVLHNDIAVALCHVLLKTYGPNDVLLLASLFEEDVDKLKQYYGFELEQTDPPVPKAKSNDKSGNTHHIPSLHSLMEELGITHWKPAGRQTMSPSEDMKKALGSLGEPQSNGTTPDFSGPCQSHPISPKIRNDKCKQIRSGMLIEYPEDESTKIRFFVARGTSGNLPPEDDLKDKLEEFAQVISNLASVFGVQDASSVYRIFWKDTDKDLMAFNRCQRHIYFNLAHYCKSSDDIQTVVTDWYLIMAHQIAHNKTMDHDEYHGSLSTRLAITYFPALREYLHDIPQRERVNGT